MPELPDIHDYIEALRPRVAGQTFLKSQIRGPFLLRTYDPPITALENKRVRGLRRLGKRIVFEMDDDLFLILHLMIAGRLRWRETQGPFILGKIGLASFEFSSGTLGLTEASTQKRASLHVVKGEAALAEHDPGGLDIFSVKPADFAAALRAENRTLKRVLTDPTLISGIGNAYSDEILHHAKLSPIRLTGKLTDDEIKRLLTSCLQVLRDWMERLRRETGEGFPENVTAFRPEMAVHGKFGQPCPVCATPIQRIRYAENESNYCPTCQTEGKLLADRSLSRLLKNDWPKTLEELEARKAAAKSTVAGMQPAPETKPAAKKPRRRSLIP